MANNLDQFPILQAIQAIQMAKHDSSIRPSNTNSDICVSPKSNHQSPNTKVAVYNTHKPMSHKSNTKEMRHHKAPLIFEIHPQFKITRMLYNPSITNKKPSLREYIFVSKQCTKQLAHYIVQENWGSQGGHGLLYKYLDYIFRCQLFNQQVTQINNQYLIFHTGLQRRSDSEFLFALHIPNKKHVQQKWRVGYGAIQQSFLSKREILYKLRYLLYRKSANNQQYLLSDLLPKRTKFHLHLEDFLFDESYQIEVDWEERILTNKDRICKELPVADFTEKWEIRQLMYLFDKALETTKKTLELNPRLAVAQGFVDTKRCEYRMELLLPLNIEYPRFSNEFYTFALAICKSIDQKEAYVAKSILNLEMAYANARLVSYVDSSWLKPHVMKAKVKTTFNSALN